MELLKPKQFNLHPPQRVITNNPRGMANPGLFTFNAPNPDGWDNLVHFEPKHQNRFILTFPEELNIPSYLVHETSRPTYRMNRDDQPWIPTHGPMRYDWDDIRIKFRDAINPSPVNTIYETMMNADLLQNPMEYKLEMLGPTNDIVERWIIRGYITSVNFGNLSYDRDELAEIEIVIHPINCHLQF